MMVGLRRYGVPSWASVHVGGLLVEDVLILQDHSGQSAFLVPDDDQPGALIVTRNRDALPVPDAELIGLRVL